jgi:hypothetical protein
MLDQLKALRARLDQAIQLLEPLAPLLGALESVAEPAPLVMPPKPPAPVWGGGRAGRPAKQRLDKVCESCGQPFVAKLRSAKFCSPNCRKTANVKKHKAAAATPPNGGADVADLEPVADWERPLFAGRVTENPETASALALAPLPWESEP